MGNWWISIRDRVYNGQILYSQTSILPEVHKVFRWGVLAPLLLLHFFQGIQVRPFDLAVGSSSVPDALKVVIPGMHETHSKHSSLILSSIFNNKNYFIYKWMYVRQDAGNTYLNIWIERALIIITC